MRLTGAAAIKMTEEQRAEYMQRNVGRSFVWTLSSNDIGSWEVSADYLDGSAITFRVEDYEPARDIADALEAASKEFFVGPRLAQTMVQGLSLGNQLVIVISSTRTSSHLVTD